MALLQPTPSASSVRQHSNSRLLCLSALTSLFLLICPPHVSLKHLRQFMSPAWVLTWCVGFSSSFSPLVLDFLMGWLKNKNVSFSPSFLSAKYASVLQSFKTVSVCLSTFFSLSLSLLRRKQDNFVKSKECQGNYPGPLLWHKSITISMINTSFTMY